MIAAFHHHGTVEMQTDNERLIDRHREPQTITLTRQSADKHAFKPGTLLDGYSTMPIVERERTQDGPVWQHRLTLEGIEDENEWFIETDLVDISPEEGWDVISRSVFTKDPDHEWFQKGQQLIDSETGEVVEGFDFMWIMDRQKRKHRAKGYFDVGMELRGVMGDKPSKRRMNLTPQVVSPGVFEGLTLFGFQSYYGFPPKLGGGYLLSGSDLDIEWDIPQVSLTDVFITTTPPPMDKAPGFWTPNSPPIVITLPVFAAQYTIHIPSGWKVSNMQSEQLAGDKPCWILAITWGYQMGSTPKS